MKYFFDTEFIEGRQKKIFGKTKPTIDLISIGIVTEDDREYYAISKDFNLKEAWNRWQPRNSCINDKPVKEYWIRDNVLKPIFDEFYIDTFGCNTPPFCYKGMKTVIERCGKSNKQIAEEVKYFCYYSYSESQIENANIEFYGYYADYDWVVFCWLFGLMIDLPKGFPWYCNDLWQEINRLESKLNPKISPLKARRAPVTSYTPLSKKMWIDTKIKSHPKYPEQINEHNALDDAKWNFELYKFLTKNF